MIFRSYIVFMVLAAVLNLSNGAAINSSEEEESNLKSEIIEAIKEFVKLVEVHHLNVSVIRSRREFYTNGNEKASVGMTMHLPVNNVALTEATLTRESTKDFSSKVAKLSEKTNLGADIRMVKVKDGNSDGTPLTRETDKRMIIDSPNYDVLLKVQNGEKGLSFKDMPTYDNIYNYIITLPDGKTKNVKVIAADVDIKVIKKSEDMKDADVEAIKKAIPEYFLSSEDDDMMAKRIVQHLDEKLNTDCSNFQLMAGIDEDFYLSTKYFVLLEVGGENMLVYCFPKKQN